VPYLLRHLSTYSPGTHTGLSFNAGFPGEPGLAIALDFFLCLDQSSPKGLCGPFAKGLELPIGPTGSHLFNPI